MSHHVVHHHHHHRGRWRGAGSAVGWFFLLMIPAGLAGEIWAPLAYVVFALEALLIVVYMASVLFQEQTKPPAKTPTTLPVPRDLDAHLWTPTSSAACAQTPTVSGRSLV